MVPSISSDDRSRLRCCVATSHATSPPSRIQPHAAPPFPRALPPEHHPVVQAEGAVVPELDFCWRQAEAGPVWRAGDVARAELFFKRNNGSNKNLVKALPQPRLQINLSELRFIQTSTIVKIFESLAVPFGQFRWACHRSVPRFGCIRCTRCCWILFLAKQLFKESHKLPFGITV